jgi:hypothetical protein
LKGKGLYVLLKSEASTQEKELLKAKASSKELERFYLSLFHLYIDFPYKYYDQKLLESIAKKYLATKEGKSDSDKLYVKYHLLFSEVNRCAARKNPVKALGQSDADLLKEEKMLIKGDHYLALYYLYRTMISYFTYYVKDKEKIEEYIKKCIALKDKVQWFFPVNIGQFLNLLYADHLFSNQRINDAWNIFKEEFSSGVSPTMYGYHYHCEQYVLLCIIKKEFKKAATILDKVFKPLIELQADILATRGCLSYAKFYITQNELKQAIHYITLGRNINEKSLYLPFDLQLRILENIYFYLKGDFEFSYRLANRNIKFVMSQKDKKMLSDYLTLFKIIIMLSQLKRAKLKKADDVLLAEKEKIGKAYRNLYCDLILQL